MSASTDRCSRPCPPGSPTVTSASYAPAAPVPAGDAPAAAALPRSARHAAPDTVVEVDHVVGRDGLVRADNTYFNVGIGQTGTLVVLRLDGHLVHAVAGRLLLASWPQPIALEKRLALPGARRPSGPLPAPTPARAPWARRVVGADGVVMVARQRPRIGRAHGGKTITVVAEDNSFRVCDRELATYAGDPPQASDPLQGLIPLVHVNDVLRRSVNHVLRTDTSTGFPCSSGRRFRVPGRARRRASIPLHVSELVSELARWAGTGQRQGRAAWTSVTAGANWAIWELATRACHAESKSIVWRSERSFVPSGLMPLNVDGNELWVQTALISGSEPTSNRLDRAGEAVNDAFARAQDAIVAMARATVSTIGKLGDRTARPRQVQVKFGLKFTAKGNVIVAEASGEATLEVTLIYDGAAGPV
ncbi:CU044_2847 family protein [Actinomycetospora sp. CA-101289]|uniref:CU044_2847 family protein n=1 Tax=Actinomycetospora sp. CA-101289 TaxID=3239893 RepID=UPI003D95515E